MQYEQKVVSIMAGIIRQRTGFRFSLPNILAFMIIIYNNNPHIQNNRSFKQSSEVRLLGLSPSSFLKNFNEQQLQYLKMIGQNKQASDRQQAIQIQSLMKQVEELKKLNEEKDRKIITLQSKITHVQEENSKLKEDIKNKETLIKNYNHNLHNKNVSLNNLEVKFQSDLDQIISRKNNEIDQLKLIIRGQEEEINLLMGDHQMMVATFEELSEAQQTKKKQRQLLQSFNAQLQAQIEQVENQNQTLIVELEETRKQLDLQNTQGEDLMSQLEVIADHIGVKAQ